VQGKQDDKTKMTREKEEWTKGKGQEPQG